MKPSPERMAELNAVGLAVRRDRGDVRRRLTAGLIDMEEALLHPGLGGLPMERVLLMHPRVRSAGRGTRGGGPAVARAVCGRAGCTVWSECRRLTDRQREAIAAEVRAL